MLMQPTLFDLSAPASSFTPYSQLSDVEIMAFTLAPMADADAKARALVKAFGSYAKAIAADPEALTRAGLSPVAVRRLKLIEAAAVRLARTHITKKPVMSSWSALLEYLHSADAYREREVFRVLFLDRKNVLIADEVMSEGTVDHAPVYPREIVKRALQLNASALILVHNHPSGDPEPSRADIAMTQEIIAAAGALKINVHDHLVIGLAGHTSFKSLGLI